MKQMSEMGMDKCIGMMGAFIKVIGIMEYSTVKAKYLSQAKGIKKGYFRIII